MEYDIVIVGAGPAGLSCACRLKQLNSDINVCVIEKGSEIGAHILSGAVFDPKTLNELFPDWANSGAPLHTEAREDHICLFTQTKALHIPELFAPRTMRNAGNYIISLGNLCRWLGEQAENLGVEIFPGFAAESLLHGEDGSIHGVITGDMGRSASGEEKSGFTAGIELRAKYTVFSEGCRGHLGKQLIQHFKLDANKDPQHYGLGIKELWKVPKEKHRAGLVLHSAGWPLSESRSTGGGFLYHLEGEQVALGLITDLSYSNPHVNPYEEFQRFKLHPEIKQYLSGGERISYGARALVKGGIQALPKMVFPGGLLIGDDAGTLNFAKIKGAHCAMKSGTLAAETLAEALQQGSRYSELSEFETRFKGSWLWEELYEQRNFGPAQHKWGNILGSAYSFIDINIFRGKLPWTLRDTQADHATLKPAAQSKKIHYPKPDGVFSFDKLSSVYLSNTNHEEDQPCHLQLKDAAIPMEQNLPTYDEPAQRYCPAGVYEVVNKDGANRLQINAQNCVHCKTCDIKDPAQNIVWTVPEGAGGPNYPNM